MTPHPPSIPSDNIQAFVRGEDQKPSDFYLESGAAPRAPLSSLEPPPRAASLRPGSGRRTDLTLLASLVLLALLVLGALLLFIYRVLFR